MHDDSPENPDVDPALDPHCDDFPRIEEYGLIGDLSTVAMVGPAGSVDFICFPEFDSPSIFAAHVDREKGGRFQIRPLLDHATEKQLYIPDTNVLISRFLADGGIAEVSDYMVVSENPDEPRQALVRRAKCVTGSIEFELRFEPRFDYARSPHSTEQLDEKIVGFVSHGPEKQKLKLHGSIAIQPENGDVRRRFQLEAGESVIFAMEEWLPETDQNPPRSIAADFSAEAFKQTCDFWRSWISHGNYDGRWREAVHRSALALKLLTSRRHGSFVAAPCFGFPNEVGGVRNWDYRYTWLRDASFCIYALLRIGFTEEATAFMNWLEDRIAHCGNGQPLETMYRIDGSNVDGEFHLDQLHGYMGSRPIRIGSTNHDQQQLDIYGEVIDSVYLFDQNVTPISRRMWAGLTRLIDYVCEHWQQPDASIWEVRSAPREFLFSRVLCWVALDRGIRLAAKRGLPAPISHWREHRDQIYESVFSDFWNEEKQSFVQFRGAEALDASTLIMPLVRFISPTDPQWLSTLEAITNELTAGSLVYRYKVGEAFSDCLDGTEGTFSICSFWLIECVSRSGDLQRARLLFEKMLGYSNRLGLFSEQVGKRGEFLGNIPQAFTHLAMISTAFDLDRRLSAAARPKAGGGLG